MNLLSALPKWLFSVAFFGLVLLLVVLFFTGKELHYKDSLGFRNPPKEKTVILGALGSRQKLSVNRTYRASMDGYLIGTLVGNGTKGGVAGLEIIADQQPNPTVRLAANTISAHRNSNWERNLRAHVFAPIRREDYYRVNTTGPMPSNQYTTEIFWVPLNTAN
ncbi:MAG: hypothetical protein ABW168_05260 [Sedimenticola sp.]